MEGSIASTQALWETAGKMIVGFIGMIIYINLSGSGHKTTLTTTDQVQNFALGGIIGGVLYNGVSILEFVFCHWLLGFVSTWRTASKKA